MRTARLSLRPKSSLGIEQTAHSDTSNGQPVSSMMNSVNQLSPADAGAAEALNRPISDSRPHLIPSLLPQPPPRPPVQASLSDANDLLPQKPKVRHSLFILNTHHHRIYHNRHELSFTTILITLPWRSHRSPNQSSSLLSSIDSPNHLISHAPIRRRPPKMRSSILPTAHSSKLWQNLQPGSPGTLPFLRSHSVHQTAAQQLLKTPANRGRRTSSRMKEEATMVMMTGQSRLFCTMDRAKLPLPSTWMPLHHRPSPLGLT